ncbi:MAG: hypothetical protein FWC41_00165 [Firmicutes bacterium]|nr:hypothetical protein [Bacillota bacterium]
MINEMLLTSKDIEQVLSKTEPIINDYNLCKTVESRELLAEYIFGKVRHALHMLRVVNYKDNNLTDKYVDELS